MAGESVPADVGSSTNAERARHKRPRAAVDPSTPKASLAHRPTSLPLGEGEDARNLSNVTPLAKKGRVEGEEEAGSDLERPRSPPPAASTSRSTTPTRSAAASKPDAPKTEGKDTKKLRERVAAMRPPGQEGEGAEKDSDIADVAAEVSTSAAQLGDQQNKKEEKDVEIADVAAEVGATAEKIEEQEQLKTDESPDPKAETRAETAAEVAESAAEVQATDERVADTASEAADAASAVQEPTPQTAAKPAAGGQPSFANYSSTASPFSAFASSASPLGSVSTEKATQPAPEAQKPKTKSAFSAAPFLASNVPLAAVPAPAAQPPSETASETTPAAAPSPFTKAAPTTNLAAASPFSSFASTSGFAAASRGAGGASAFSAFSAAPSAFSKVPGGDPAAPSTAQGDKSASPAPGSGSEGRKVGEPEAPDETKPVYTEKELVTGEEEEETLHQVKCKLYEMSEGQWAERGMGPIRLNQTAGKGDKHGARLVMRADATHRLLLNAPLFREFSIEVSNEKYVRFTVIGNGSNPISYMLRTGNPALAENLVQAVRDKVATL
ncbi:hypothetical protein JCM8202v2_000442 [Rhodotorula sphaerocarpa]